MNIFEGARQIVLFVAGGAVVITVLIALNTSAYYKLAYILAAPNAPFIKTDSDCQIEGSSIYFDHKSSSGKSISVTICLEPMTFITTNKQEFRLIPYKIDADGMAWGKESHSPEISIYENQVKKRFTMTANDEEVAIKKAEKQWRSQFFETIELLIVGLAIFGALVWATGWIFRGFLGIPRGKDQKHHP